MSQTSQIVINTNKKINVFLIRKCEQNQVFFKSGDPHPYCKNSCEVTTMCGEVEVPEAHLEVSQQVHNPLRM